MLAPLHAAPFAYFFLLILFISGILGFKYPDLVSRFKFYPYAVARAKRIESMFTSLFFHAGWAHLLANLVFAVVFLPEVEYMLVDDFGRYNGWVLLMCTIVGIALFAGLTAVYQYRSRIGFSSLGFSGVVFGIAEFFYFYLPIEINDDGVITGGFHGYQIGLIGFITLYLCVRHGIGKAAPLHFHGALGGLLLAVIIRPELVSEIISHISDSMRSESK